MAIDSKSFRQVLGYFATGVTIVSCVDSDGQPRGLTANAFASLSLNPPLVLFCLDNRSSSMEAFRQAGTFAVNVLQAEQRSLSDRFARAGDDKFSEGDWCWDPHRPPVLGSALAHLCCRTWATYDGGDHTIFVGEVQEMGTEGGEPLLFFRGKYGALAAQED